MATKNLARTIMEGGRRGYNKYERRYSNGVLRSKERDYIRNCIKDPEHSIDKAEPKRKKVVKEFYDRLMPLHRKVDRHLGKTWGELRGQINKKYDSRKLKDWHMLDHLYQMMFFGSKADSKLAYFANYIVNENDIIEEREYPTWKEYVLEKKKKHEYLDEHWDEIISFLEKDRIAFDEKGVLHWYICDSKHRYYFEFAPTSFHKIAVTFGKVLDGLNSATRLCFRKGPKLTRQEVNYFRSLPEFVQENILQMFESYIRKI